MNSATGEVIGMLAGGLPRGIGLAVALVAACSAPLARVPIVALAQEAELSRPAVVEQGPFGDFNDDEDYPGPDQLRSILGQVPGQRYDISEKKKNNRRVSYISGLFRLDVPWPADAGLRLSLWDPDGLQLHLWNGQKGVTLRYYRQIHQTWAACGTTREDDKPQPSELALWATDAGRYRRVGIGTVEVHYRDGNLTLTRGDLELLSVPMEGPPSEVFLEGSGLVRGLAMVQSTVAPRPPPSRPVVVQVANPAELEWETELPEGVSFDKLPDGRVELRAAERTQDAQAGTTVCGAGLHEFIFEVEDADVGTGIYLGDREGRQLCRLAFFRDRETGRTTFGLLHPSQREIDRSHDVRRRVVPYSGRHQWLRVTLGAGVLKYWTSGDGTHWSPTAPAAQPLEGDCRQVGLYCLSHDKARAIKLRSIEVRRLDALTSLVPETVLGQADMLFEGEGDAFVKAGDLETWEQEVARTLMPDRERDVWWRACALRTLAAGPNVALSQPLLDRLLERTLAETRQIQTGLKILEEAALVCHSGDAPAVDRFLSHYERFGRTAARRGEPDPFSAISGALVCSSLWPERRLPAFFDYLLRHELFTKVGEDRWEEVAGLCRRLEYWGRTQQDEPPLSGHARHLVRWAAAQAAGHLPGDDGDKPAGVPLEWRHPLLQRLSKEDYNVLAELEATLKAQAYREACQVISTSVGTEGLGLLPDGKDHRLWVSLPLAVESAMREYPALRKTMQDDFGPLGELRIKQATTAGDAATVETAALQFYGTRAAREAHLWLGDRSLSGGRFVEAFEHYRQALRSGSDDDRSGSLARLRLAGAFMGRDVGSPLDGPVRIGERNFTAPQFERLVDEVRQTHQSLQSMTESIREAAAPAMEGDFLPGRYQVRPWAHVDGRRVKRPHAISDRGLDWAGRQTAVLVTDRQMLVNNQIDQIAFDLETGRLLWAQCRAVEDGYQQWPLVRMQPVCAGTAVFVRQLADEGPELVSLESTTGRMVWSSRPDGHVASDPLVLGDNLLALGVGYGPGEKLALSLTSFDPDSGRILRQAPLAEFRDLWQHRLPCRATIAGERIVATVGGCVLSCDASGRVLWQRRQIWVPPPGDSRYRAPEWLQQVHELPLVDDGRVYATQPGVWGVECLDLETGRLVWRRAVGGLARLVGFASGRLVVETTDGLEAVDPVSGETVWHHPFEHRLKAGLCREPGLILAYHLERDNQSGEGPQFVLVWIDAETGQPREQSVLSTPERSDAWLGPLVASGGRQWGFFASPEEPASRDILEFTLGARTRQLTDSSGRGAPDLYGPNVAP